MELVKVVAYHLLGHHDNGLDGKPPVAVVKEVFQRGTQQIYDQDVVKTFLTKVVDIRDAG